jgi:hypothetical protein
MGMAQTFPLRPAGGGRYVYVGPVLTMPGTWDFAFRIANVEARPFTTHVREQLRE